MGKYATDIGEFELRRFNLKAMGHTLPCPKCGTKHTRAGGSQRAYSWQCMRCDYCFNADESRLTPVNKQNALTRDIIDDREEKAGEPDTQEGEKEEMATRMTKAEAEKRAAELGKGHVTAHDKYGHYFVLGPKGDTFVTETNKEGDTLYDPNQHLTNITNEKETQGTQTATAVKTQAPKAEKTTFTRTAVDKMLKGGPRPLAFWMKVFPNHPTNERWNLTAEEVEVIKKAAIDNPKKK